MAFDFLKLKPKQQNKVPPGDVPSVARSLSCLGFLTAMTEPKVNRHIQGEYELEVSSKIKIVVSFLLGAINKQPQPKTPEAPRAPAPVGEFVDNTLIRDIKSDPLLPQGKPIKSNSEDSLELYDDEIEECYLAIRVSPAIQDFLLETSRVPELTCAPFGENAMALKVCQQLADLFPLGFFLHILSKKVNLYISGHSYGASVAALLSLKLLSQIGGSNQIRAHLFGTIPICNIQLQRWAGDRGHDKFFYNFYTAGDVHPMTVSLLISGLLHPDPQTKSAAECALQYLLHGVDPASAAVSGVPGMTAPGFFQNLKDVQQFRSIGALYEFGDSVKLIPELPFPNIPERKEVAFTSFTQNLHTDFEKLLKVQKDSQEQVSEWDLFPKPKKLALTRIGENIAVRLDGRDLSFTSSVEFFSKKTTLDSSSEDTVINPTQVTYMLRKDTLTPPEKGMVEVTVTFPFQRGGKKKLVIEMEYTDASQNDMFRRYITPAPWELLEKAWMFTIFSSDEESPITQQLICLIDSLFDSLSFTSIFHVCLSSSKVWPACQLLLQLISYDDWCNLRRYVHQNSETVTPLLAELKERADTETVYQILLIYVTLLFSADKISEKEYRVYVVEELLKEGDFSDFVLNICGKVSNEIFSTLFNNMVATSLQADQKEDEMSVGKLISVGHFRTMIKSRIKSLKAKQHRNESGDFTGLIMEQLDLASQFGSLWAALLQCYLEKPVTVQVDAKKLEEGVVARVARWTKSIFYPFLATASGMVILPLSAVVLSVTQRNLGLLLAAPISPLFAPLIGYGVLQHIWQDHYLIKNYGGKLYHIATSIPVPRFYEPKEKHVYFHYEIRILQAIASVSSDRIFSTGVLTALTSCYKPMVDSWITLIRLFYKFRAVLSMNQAIGVVGARRMGKSTLCRKLWNIEVNSGALAENKTVDIAFYSVPECPELHLIDYPGFNETDEMIRQRNALSWQFASLFIIVVNCEAFGHHDVSYCTEIAQLGLPVLICLNKADEVLYRVIREKAPGYTAAERMANQLELAKTRECGRICQRYPNVEMWLTAIDPQAPPSDIPGSVNLWEHHIQDREAIRLWTIAKLTKSGCDEDLVKKMISPIIFNYAKTIPLVECNRIATTKSVENEIKFLHDPSRQLPVPGPAVLESIDFFVSQKTDKRAFVSSAAIPGNFFQVFSRILYGQSNYAEQLGFIVGNWLYDKPFSVIKRAPPEFKDSEVHVRRKCDGCEMNPILGTAHHCKTCQDYDLCDACHERKVVTLSHKSDHSMQQVVAPKKKCLIALTNGNLQDWRATCDEYTSGKSNGDELAIFALAQVFDIRILVYCEARKRVIYFDPVEISDSDSKDYDFEPDEIRESLFHLQPVFLGHLANGQFVPIEFKKKEIIEREENAKILGSGGFSEVYQGTFDGKEVAVKELKIDSAKPMAFILEAFITRGLPPDNFVQILGIQLTGDRIRLAMELMDYSLQVVIDNKTLTEKQKTEIALQIVDGVVTMHSLQLCHRDLKPANILLKETSNGYRAKIADFGLCKALATGGGNHTVGGTPGFLAPEILTGSYDLRVDIYSLGRIFQKLGLLIHDNQVLERCVAKNPKERPDLCQIRSAILGSSLNDPIGLSMKSLSVFSK